MKTIQNAFKISFLFRDGAIAISGLDKFGYPIIRPSQPSEKEAIDDRPYQLISSLTTPFCDVIIFSNYLIDVDLIWFSFVRK